MRDADIAAVVALADAAHPALHEDASVFKDRLSLYPKGCLVLDRGDRPRGAGQAAGYAVGHPWHGDAPPPLNTVLGALPNDANRFYLHDVVVSPAVRGGGHASEAIERLLATAAAFSSVILVSVYGTAPFWSRFGFVEAPERLPPGALRAYGEDALFMIRQHSK